MSHPFLCVRSSDPDSCFYTVQNFPSFLFSTMPSTHAYLIAARQQEIQELESLAQTCELVHTTSDLIHALQAERGASTFYLASHGTRFGQDWQQACLATDAAQVRFAALLDAQTTTQPLTGSSRLYGRIALALDALEALSTLRSQVKALSPAPFENTQHYITVVHALIALVFEAADMTVDPAVSRLLLALFNLIEGKESAGLERANGSRVLATAMASQSDQQLLTHLIEQQEQSLTRFEHFCGDTILAQWRALQATLPIAELERLRRKLLTHPMTQTADIATDWFAVTTARLDGQHLVETHLAEQLKQACIKRIEQTRTRLADQTDVLSIQQDLPQGLKQTSIETLADKAADTIKDARFGSRLNRTVFDLLQEQSRTLQTVSDELASVRAALEDRKLIDRAKGLLMSQQGLNEEAAYALLRQKAMNQNVRVSDVAQALLAMADFFPPTKS